MSDPTVGTPDIDMEDILGAAEEPVGTQEDVVPEQDTEPARSGGYAPLVTAKRKELIELEKKAESFSTSGAYLKKDANGNEYVDHLAFQEDTVRIGRLRRELEELRDRERSLSEERSKRGAVVTAVAREVLKRLLPNVPQALQKTVTESYVKMVQSFSQANEWVKPAYVDKANIEAAMMQVFDTAVGSATRSSWQGSTSVEGAPPAPPEKAPEDDMDDFTNNMLYAFERRQRSSMTVAEAKAAEREAAQAGKEA